MFGLGALLLAYACHPLLQSLDGLPLHISLFLGFGQLALLGLSHFFERRKPALSFLASPLGRLPLSSMELGISLCRF